MKTFFLLLILIKFSFNKGSKEFNLANIINNNLIISLVSGDKFVIKTVIHNDEYTWDVKIEENIIFLNKLGQDFYFETKHVDSIKSEYITFIYKFGSKVEILDHTISVKILPNNYLDDL